MVLHQIDDNFLSSECLFLIGRDFSITNIPFIITFSISFVHNSALISSQETQQQRRKFSNILPPYFAFDDGISMARRRDSMIIDVKRRHDVVFLVMTTLRYFMYCGKT